MFHRNTRLALPLSGKNLYAVVIPFSITTFIHIFYACMKPSRTIFFILIFVAALLFLKFVFFPGKKNNAPQGKGGPAASLTVTGFVVKPQKFENTVQSNGTIYANE